jgi:hypothetical protein
VLTGKDFHQPSATLLDARLAITKFGGTKTGLCHGFNFHVVFLLLFGGSGAFLTNESGMGKKSASGSWMNNFEHFFFYL